MSGKDIEKPRIFEEIRERWPLMTLYERFEQVVAILLSLIIAVIIIIALVQLTFDVVPLVIAGAMDPLDQDAFQSIFGAILTLLIAMEFKHSIVRVVVRRDSIVQVRTVILIALLALSRKFIILDTKETDAATIFALAASLLVFGAVYWLLRERDYQMDRNTAN